ncbi:radical SAM protein [Bartonella tamiae]|uniref:Radical SAM additional 4Fe4S-binding domain-containing protein n=1 Tax=Bartonella tamiae Th239 TaxID=1094558 RepID=J0QWF0_9HYPH|nr:radical SAM protein [Bartonella tamiae]EJF90361.1 radical SAM additional 4Fe4S-binding domain-containing protein [Bartonella tamiae Th239]EJF93698.1 radical SAM additional 4Fe4S-binding domain-containing protein [Bartonella tamiae Th307]
MSNVASKLNVLEIILKLTERCNLNCTYCYVFNKGDYDETSSQALISDNSVNDVIDFVLNAIESYELKLVRIIFHGGEPLLYPKKKFDNLCNSLKALESVDTSITLSLQTNGVLIDETWVEIFSRHDVTVGISLDGNKEMNDQYRLDKKGRSSYERSIKGLRLLQESYNQNKFSHSPSILMVANCENDIDTLYDHVFNNLGVSSFDILLPDDNYLDESRPSDDLMGKYFTRLLDLYLNDERDVFIRLFDAPIYILNSNSMDFLGFSARVHKMMVSLTINTDGLLYVNDVLKPTGAYLASAIGNIKDFKLEDFMASQQYKMYISATEYVPSECQDCIWRNPCSGGALQNRYSKENGFSNKTIYCGTNRSILSRVSEYLIIKGVDESKIMSNIGL